MSLPVPREVRKRPKLLRAARYVSDVRIRSLCLKLPMRLSMKWKSDLSALALPNSSSTSSRLYRGFEVLNLAMMAPSSLRSLDMRCRLASADLLESEHGTDESNRPLFHSETMTVWPEGMSRLSVPLVS